MAICPLCNDLQVGEGEWLSCDTWIANLVASSCRYCQLLVAAAKEFEPEFLLQDHTLRPKNVLAHPYEEPGISFSVQISNAGQIDLVSRDQGWYRCDVRLELYRSARDNLQGSEPDVLKVPVRGDIAAVPGDPAMWTFLRSSLQTCLKEHPECMDKQDPDRFPERLLSLQRDSQGNPVLRLVQTQHERPQSAYAALSHCWGSEPFIRTTTANVRLFQKGIDYSTLPRTFQDAISAAIELDIAYIWIDSLCIIQDQENDWAWHAEQMDKIYENALIVIAAVASSAASVPFLGKDAVSDRYAYRTVDIKIPTEENVRDQGPLLTTKARLNSVQRKSAWIEGPLETRAWAYQEQYCAVRIISFTEIEAKWRCKMSQGCECYGGLEDPSSESFDLGNDKAAILTKWREVVQEYAKRELTYATDRLPAIAGVASRFRSKLESRYIAGLWEIELPFNLSWYRRDGTDSPTHTPLALPAMDNGVPSWSWASNHGECEWLWVYFQGQWDLPERPKLQRESQVQVGQVSCVPRATNALGAVQVGSFIELHGRIVPAVMESDNYGRASVCRQGFNPQVVMLDCKVTSDTDSLGQHGERTHRDASFDHVEMDDTHEGSIEPEPIAEIRNTGPVFCLLLYTATWEEDTQACVLILGQIEVAGVTCYQRLGIGSGSLKDWIGTFYDGRRKWAMWQGWDELEEWEEWESWFADAETKTIRIV